MELVEVPGLGDLVPTMLGCVCPKVKDSLILHHNMGIKYADEPFNMGIFFFLPKASFKWVHFQTSNTHIRAFLYWSHPPGVEVYPGYGED